MEDVVNYLPNFDQRVRRFVRIQMGRYWDEHHKNEVEGETWWNSVKRFDKYMKDNPDIVEEKTKEIAGILKKDLTFDDFEVSCKDFCEKYNIKKKEEEVETE